MSYRLLFHPLAMAEYEDAFHWYEGQQQGLGDRFEKMVEERLQQIAEHPEHYKICQAPYREVTIAIFPFTIVFKADNKKMLVYISAIYHHCRQPHNKFRK